MTPAAFPLLYAPVLFPWLMGAWVLGQALGGITAVASARRNAAREDASR